MSETLPPGQRPLWPWLALLTLPLAVGVGWLVGTMPGTRSAPKAPSGGGSTSVTASAQPADAETGAREIVVPGLESSRHDAEPEANPEPSEYSQWTSIESAVVESKRNGKPILIDFNAEWCGPCRRLKQQVFDDGARAQVVQTTVIPVSVVDRVREDGQNPPGIADLQQRFGVAAFPTLVVFSPANGKAIKTEGFGDPDETLAWIKGAAQAVR